jgi:ATP-dependent Clp protease ATP-binding subunit ClpB
MWQDERKSLNRVKDLKQELAKAQREMDVARSKGGFAKPGELLHSTIQDLQHELEEREKEEDSEDRNATKNNRLLIDAVDANAIASIVALATGIPVSKITGKESKKLLHMEDELRNRVVGQDHALEAVSHRITGSSSYPRELPLRGTIWCRKNEIVQSISRIPLR